ncbi:MAG: hypothetical protein IH946_07940, partial [Bacteroidetes bacterium]|nr:hypothetical protein [Bacteroidota bacterium]
MDPNWNDKATFFCGHRKTGTTLLLNLFDSHPQLAVFPTDSGFFYAYYPPYDTTEKSDEEKIDRLEKVMFGNLHDDLTALDAWTTEMSFPIDEIKKVFRSNMDGQDYSAANFMSQAVYAYH